MSKEKKKKGKPLHFRDQNSPTSIKLLHNNHKEYSIGLEHSMLGGPGVDLDALLSASRVVKFTLVRSRHALCPEPQIACL